MNETILAIFALFVLILIGIIGLIVINMVLDKLADKLSNVFNSK
jgi:hypothetical protein